MREPGADEVQDDGFASRCAESAHVSPADDARFMMTVVQSTISSADTKASIVGTMLTVFLGLAVPVLSSRNVWHTWTPAAVLTVVTAAASVVAAALTASELLRVLVPRLAVSEFSRYAFPDVARCEIGDLVAATPGADRREAWVQALTLSRISVLKHRHLGFALHWFSATVCLGVATMILGVAASTNG